MKSPATKPKRGAKRPIDWKPDYRGYGMVDDSAFDGEAQRMFAYVRSERPANDKIAVFAQAIMVKEEGKQRIQLCCVLLNAREALMLKRFVERFKLGRGWPRRPLAKKFRAKGRKP